MEKFGLGGLYEDTSLEMRFPGYMWTCQQLSPRDQDRSWGCNNGVSISTGNAVNLPAQLFLYNNLYVGTDNPNLSTSTSFQGVADAAAEMSALDSMDSTITTIATSGHLPLEKEGIAPAWAGASAGAATWLDHSSSQSPFFLHDTCSVGQFSHQLGRDGGSSNGFLCLQNMAGAGEETLLGERDLVAHKLSSGGNISSSSESDFFNSCSSNNMDQGDLVGSPHQVASSMHSNSNYEMRNPAASSTMGTGTCDVLVAAEAQPQRMPNCALNISFEQSPPAEGSLTKRPRSQKKNRDQRPPQLSTCIDFRQATDNYDPYIPDTEAIAQVKEMVYRAAAMRPVCLGPDSPPPEKLRRKNVRVSSDPQTAAARRRRERVGERLRVLQKLVPGGSRMDTAAMLDEAANYLKFLKSQVVALERGFGSTGSPCGNPMSVLPQSPNASLCFPMQTSFPSYQNA